MIPNENAGLREARLRLHTQELLKGTIVPPHVSRQLASLVIERSLETPAAIPTVLGSCFQATRDRSSIAAELMEFAFGASGALQSHQSAATEEVVRFLIQHVRDGDGLDWREAIADRMQVRHIFAYSPGVTDLLGAFLDEQTPVDPDSLPDRMRAAHQLTKEYVILTGPSPGTTIQNSALRLRKHSLSPMILRVALAHVCPLLAGNYESPLALELLGNVGRWLNDLDQRRREFIDRYRSDHGLAAVEPNVTPDQDAEIYMMALGAALTAALQTIGQGERPDLDTTVAMEKAFNETGAPLVTRGVLRWLEDERVAATILSLGERLRALRLSVLPLLEQVMFSGRKVPETVQRAAISFARSFTGGFTKEEARFHARPVVVRRNDGGREQLDDEVNAILESDPKIRERLLEIANDAARPPAVRREAMETLLAIATLPDERAHLMETACEGDPPLIDAFLAWAETHHAHSSYPYLARLKARRPDVGVSDAFFRAAAAASHAGVAEMMENDVLDDVPGADAVLLRMGSLGVLDSLRAHREIRRQVALQNETSAKRDEALAAAHRENIQAINETGAAAVTQVTISRHLAEQRFVQTLAAAEQARVVVALERSTRELLQLQETIQPVRNELARLEQSLRELTQQHDQTTRRIDGCVNDVRSHEQKKTANERKLANLSAEIQSLGRQRNRDAAELNDIARSIDGVERDIRRAGDNPQRLQSLHRSLNRLRDKGARLNRNLETADSRMRQAHREIDSLMEANRHLDHLIDETEKTVRALRQKFAEIVREQGRTRQRRTVQMEEYDRISRAIQSVITRIRAEEAESKAILDRLGERMGRIETERLQAQSQLERHEKAAMAALRAVDTHRAAVQQLTAEMIAIEDRIANLNAQRERNRELAANELSERDAAARQAEAVSLGRRMLRDELRLNTDLLMTMLGTLLGPSAESAAVLRKLEQRT